MNRLASSTFAAAIASALVLLGPIAGRAVAHAQSQAARTLTVTMPSKIVNRQMQPLIDGTRRGFRLDAHEGDGLAWWPDAVFGDGTIDVDLRGKDVQQQSFLG